MRHRSEYGACIIKSIITERSWSQRLPAAGVVRPRQCVRCRRGTFEGGGVWVHSHGVRKRQQLGPVEAGRSFERRVVVARRFRCIRKTCGAVMLVVPTSVTPKKRYSAGAIASAIAEWSGFYPRTGSSRDRAKESSGSTSSRWRQPARWAAEAVAARLFPSAPRHRAATRRCREAARTIAQSIASYAPPDTPYEALVFIGAEHLR